MNDAKLEAELRGIGYEVFAVYYRLFCDRSLTNQALIDRLLADSRDARKGRNGGAYTLGTCRTKVSKSKGIIAAGRGPDALRRIAAGSRNDNAKTCALYHLEAMEGG